MNPNAIFGPVSALALWTGAVLLYTGARRIAAVRARRLTTHDFRLGESPEVPPEISVGNRNLMNLLEMPVLFYVVALAMYVTRQVDGTAVAFAWVYVALRFAHSLIHLGYNRVTHRLFAYAASNLVLLGLWIRFMTRVL